MAEMGMRTRVPPTFDRIALSFRSAGILVLSPRNNDSEYRVPEH